MSIRNGLMQGVLTLIGFIAISSSWTYASLALLHFFNGNPRERIRPRLKLSDVLALFVTIQPPLIYVAGVVHSHNVGRVETALFGGLLIAMFVAMWWVGVRELTRRGIGDVRRRAVFLALTLPAMLVAAIPGVFSLFAIPMALLMESHDHRKWFIISLAVATAGWFIGYSTRWVMRTTDVENAALPDN